MVVVVLLLLLVVVVGFFFFFFFFPFLPMVQVLVLDNLNHSHSHYTVPLPCTFVCVRSPQIAKKIKGYNTTSSPPRPGSNKYHCLFRVLHYVTVHQVHVCNVSIVREPQEFRGEYFRGVVPRHHRFV